MEKDSEIVATEVRDGLLDVEPRGREDLGAVAAVAPSSQRPIETEPVAGGVFNNSTAALNPVSGESNLRKRPPSLGTMSLTAARPISTYRRVDDPSFTFSGLLLRFATDRKDSPLPKKKKTRARGGAADAVIPEAGRGSMCPSRTHAASSSPAVGPPGRLPIASGGGLLA